MQEKIGKGRVKTGEAAKYMNIDPNTVRGLVAKNLLPASRPSGKHLRFRQEDLEIYDRSTSTSKEVRDNLLKSLITGREVCIQSIRVIKTTTMDIEAVNKLPRNLNKWLKETGQ